MCDGGWDSLMLWGTCESQGTTNFVVLSSLFICVCVHVCVGVYEHACVPSGQSRHQVHLLYYFLSSPLSQSLSLNLWFVCSWLGWKPASLSHVPGRIPWNWGSRCVPNILHTCWDLDSSPHECAARAPNHWAILPVHSPSSDLAYLVHYIWSLLTECFWVCLYVHH